MNDNQLFFDELLKDLDSFIHRYENYIENNDDLENYIYLGIGYLLQENYEMAETIWMSKILESNNLDEDTGRLIQCLKITGDYLLENEEYYLAKIIYEQIYQLSPDLKLEHKLSSVYLNLANLLMAQYQYEKVIKLLEQALNYCPDNQDLYLALVRVLKINGQAKEAIFYCEKALKLNPNHLILQWENFNILPILYNSQEEISFYRSRFTEELDKILNNISLKTELDKKIALQLCSLNTNFYLQYQGKDDFTLQQKYGKLIKKILKANYPDVPEINREINKEGKIKLGFISCHFRDHNGANWALGWLKYLDKEKFDITCYYLENIEDELTQEFKKYSHKFYAHQGDLEQLIKIIIDDRIDIIIYTDIGMKPEITKLASFRLAPIQCVTLGHPITSGLETIDYYISRELMEGKNAQKYYTEKLLLLKNIGICLSEIKLPSSPKPRQEFNLQEENIVYLCTQSLFKYLPQFDYIYPEIAQKITLAKFVFIEFPISHFVNQQFRERLNRSFRKYNLNYENYCVILPRLNEEEFKSLHLRGDIFLDPFQWSADNTCRLAVSCHLPIVTCPGEFMRGRHCYGILKMIGVEETIVYSEKDYIKMSIELGNNSQWREKIREKMKENKNKLFNDLECVKSLEKILQKIARHQD